ncbi:aminotransferase class I/II-fold pyridoxal phosphate-dependent enzyme [Cohnella ginsengisoli]|uniref:homocysteine desulfhydrase n=1 Tax=Cohnella ginsengisoli TaxID=425004 RepID=A0A9X4KJC8_9BACL|nr:aminotransferase class I/II-fold pyridoxal phosphate-dependent enzyme [Cohnella ginsengisoli]MDG0791282.1 aminotransferase class I/II-fold pyridoxal phosphate-dependent enzyme [Cohnella ginsengisoli]
MTTSERDKNHFYTQVSHDSVDSRHQGAITMPVYQSSLFAFETHQKFDEAMKDVLAASVYSRGNNPTVMYLEEKIARLEGGESARCFASGMGAISAVIFALVGSGEHIVCVDQAYGPTRELLADLSARFGVEVTFLDGKDTEGFAAAIRPNTKLFYLESPTSGLFEMQDLPALASLAKAHGIITAIDNSWATPYFQKPLSMGIDLVMHSLTKYFSGHSDSLGGVVVGSRELIGLIGHRSYLNLGAAMAPQTASLITRGLRTLPLRLERHQSSAFKIASHLAAKPDVVRVNHPGLAGYPQKELAARQLSGYGGLFSFVTRHSVENMKQWATDLDYFRIGVSWGGYESLVTVGAAPAKDIEDGSALASVRMYIGIEDPDELIADIERNWAKLYEPSLRSQSL